MDPAGLPMGDAFQFGWDTFKKNAVFLIAIQIAAGVSLAVVETATGFLENWSGYHAAIASIAYSLLGMVIDFGYKKVSLRLRDEGRVEFANMFDTFDLLPYYIVATVVVGLGVFVGLLFLIIPGIIIAIRLWLYAYVILDERADPFEAIQRSFELTRGYGFDLFLFGMLILAVNILGFLCFFVGVFVSMPVSWLATAHVYRHLCARAAARLAEPPPPPPAS